MEKKKTPKQFDDLLSFLSDKYRIDKNSVFVEFTTRRPPGLKGGEIGFYEGLLSFRRKAGRNEFLITVFSVSREPLLTLAHEFAHLVRNLESGKFDKDLGPPDDATERMLDDQALQDLAEFRRREGRQSSNEE